MSINDLEIRTELIKSAGLTTGLTDQEVALLADLAEEQSYPKGSIVIREDARSRDLFLVKQGRISIRLKLPSDFGQDEVIYTMREGQILGEIALVDGSPRSASAFTENDVIVYCFDFNKLSSFLDERPHIGYLFMRNIAAILATRIRNTNMLWRNTLLW